MAKSPGGPPRGPRNPGSGGGTPPTQTPEQKLAAQKEAKRIAAAARRLREKEEKAKAKAETGRRDSSEQDTLVKNTSGNTTTKAKHGGTRNVTIKNKSVTNNYYGTPVGSAPVNPPNTSPSQEPAQPVRIADSTPTPEVAKPLKGPDTPPSRARIVAPSIDGPKPSDDDEEVTNRRRSITAPSAPKPRESATDIQARALLRSRKSGAIGVGDFAGARRLEKEEARKREAEAKRKAGQEAGVDRYSPDDAEAFANAAESARTGKSSAPKAPKAPPPEDEHDEHVKEYREGSHDAHINAYKERPLDAHVEAYRAEQAKIAARVLSRADEKRLSGLFEQGLAPGGAENIEIAQKREAAAQAQKDFNDRNTPSKRDLTLIGFGRKDRKNAKDLLTLRDKELKDLISKKVGGVMTEAQEVAKTKKGWKVEHSGKVYKDEKGNDIVRKHSKYKDMTPEQYREAVLERYRGKAFSKVLLPQLEALEARKVALSPDREKGLILKTAHYFARPENRWKLRTLSAIGAVGGSTAVMAMTGGVGGAVALTAYGGYRLARWGAGVVAGTAAGIYAGKAMNHLLRSRAGLKENETRESVAYAEAKELFQKQSAAGDESNFYQAFEKYGLAQEESRKDRRKVGIAALGAAALVGGATNLGGSLFDKYFIGGPTVPPSARGSIGPQAPDQPVPSDTNPRGPRGVFGPQAPDKGVVPSDVPPGARGGIGPQAPDQGVVPETTYPKRPGAMGPQSPNQDVVPPAVPPIGSEPLPPGSPSVPDAQPTIPRTSDPLPLPPQETPGPSELLKPKVAQAPLFGEHILRKGDTLWDIAKEKLAREPQFANLNEAQKTYFLDSQMKQLQAYINTLTPEQMKSEFGFRSPNINQAGWPGDKINLSKLDDMPMFETALKGALELSEAQQANIYKNLGWSDARAKADMALPRASATGTPDQALKPVSAPPAPQPVPQPPNNPPVTPAEPSPIPENPPLAPPGIDYNADEEIARQGSRDVSPIVSVPNPEELEEERERMLTEAADRLRAETPVIQDDATGVDRATTTEVLASRPSTPTNLEAPDQSVSTTPRVPSGYGDLTPQQFETQVRSATAEEIQSTLGSPETWYRGADDGMRNFAKLDWKGAGSFLAEYDTDAENLAQNTGIPKESLDAFVSAIKRDLIAYPDITLEGKNVGQLLESIAREGVARSVDRFQYPN